MSDRRPLPVFALTWAVCVALFCYAIAFGCVALVVDGTQKDFDQEHELTISQRDAEIADTRWRNEFWEDVASNDATTSGLVRDVRRLYVDGDGLTPRETNAVVQSLRREAFSGNAHDILAPDGSLTDPSMAQVERIRSGHAPAPEAIPVAIDPEDPTYRRVAADEIVTPKNVLAAWSSIAVILYGLFGRHVTIGGWRYDRGAWLGITEVEGAPIRKALVALLYAPVLLVVGVLASALWAVRLLVRSPGRIRAWWKLARDPYRAEIRQAERALAELRAANAETELIRAAEEVLADWNDRHARERSVVEDERARAARDDRIAKARGVLLHLSARTEVEEMGTRPARHGSRQRTSGS